MRGFSREAYTRLMEGDLEWIKAELWADSKWVTLLSTTFHSAIGAEVCARSSASLCRGEAAPAADARPLAHG